MIRVTIDDVTYTAREGSTIIDAARENYVDIPSLGYDPRVSPPTNIEISVVEVLENGKPRIVSATRIWSFKRRDDNKYSVAFP